MKTRLVTFDAAQTLFGVTWTLAGFARDCMTRLGIQLPESAYDRLLQLYGESLAEYLAINSRRDPEAGERFWIAITSRWFGEFGVDPSFVKPSRELSEQLMFGEDSQYFRVYDDVIPCLDELKSMGIRTAVVSNWDYTLHRTMRAAHLDKRFEAVIASLEEGVEKPDPALFEIALKRLGVGPAETIHVGDDILDDVEGARRAGIEPILLCRDGSAGTSHRGVGLRVVGSLSCLPEVIRSIA